MSTRFGFVSTFPPTQCGLATFTDSLRTAIVGAGRAEGHVVRLVDEQQPRPAEHVVAQWRADDSAGMHRAAAHLNDCDVVLVQHEYGVFGGTDGADVLLLLDELEVPAIVVLHTVLSTPTAHQRSVLEAVIARADAAVVMTKAAHDRLRSYDIDLEKVSIIAHGAPDIAAVRVHSAPMFRSTRCTVLTWGLLGPGKGIEWGIEAMAQLRDVTPMPNYVIAGQTHPKVVRFEGEVYRHSLAARVREFGVGDAVTFDARYRDADDLSALIRAADIVLLPYDSTDQITSGVLIEAVAAGKPVVATGFPHAQELLSNGAGTIVAHRDPTAIADALRTIITRADIAAAMSQAGKATSEELLWPAIAEQYRELSERLIKDRVAA